MLFESPSFAFDDSIPYCPGDWILNKLLKIGVGSLPGGVGSHRGPSGGRGAKEVIEDPDKVVP